MKTIALKYEELLGVKPPLKTKQLSYNQHHFHNQISTWIVIMFTAVKTCLRENPLFFPNKKKKMINEKKATCFINRYKLILFL